MNRIHPLQQTELVPVFQDQFGRSKRKLRISVTDRCNFKCVYCMPEHPEWMKKHDLLSFEELYHFCEFMVRRGIEQIRITGGEPLMRQGVVHFIAELQQLKNIGLKRISMTTNGHYLKQYAAELKQAGLDDLNISLDSLDTEQFEQLTAKKLQPVLEGIQVAQQAGFSIKINTVLIKGINDNQILPLAHWAKRENVELRFIEFMPLDGDQNWSRDHVVSEQDILDQLATEFEVKIGQRQGANPARTYKIDGMPIGIISTITNSFCGSCDRLRLNAQGEFFNCLFSTQGLKLKDSIQQLRQQSSSAEQFLQQQLQPYIWNKAAGFHAIQAQQKQLNPEPKSNPNFRKISMHMIGG
ncbi:GTP 3',8-cyclase MoaA [Acinetobacter sp. LoGeW2-3]|uniref:GTP 3',8-cyclase MoaA n=1 Tax=Acinetobacter sp. LoGeW2-3 TaxID=1808001 RepID=UPI000C05A157|nr:GTP 3',8-cyclase MoaA [Acinetobacter sp. LoGeW2-3]ATO20482.1 GTP 3',8-cyclase MoaA [Acinetobacter sp. LoGeW2-3]